MEYLPQSISAPQMPSTSYGTKSPAKGKRKKTETPTTAAIKRRFEFDDDSLVLLIGRGVFFDYPNIAIALKDQDKIASSRRTGRSCRAAPVF